MIARQCKSCESYLKKNNLDLVQDGWRGEEHESSKGLVGNVGMSLLRL